MRISDWSSDVCSSDLQRAEDPQVSADLPPTDVEMRHNATAYWSDDAIPVNHPARKDAEARWGRGIAAHDKRVGDIAVGRYRQRNTRLLVLLWITSTLNPVAAPPHLAPTAATSTAKAQGRK